MTTNVKNNPSVSPVSILFAITDPFYHNSISCMCKKCKKSFSAQEVKDAGFVCPCCGGELTTP